MNTPPFRITIEGPPGIGKSRLASFIAGQLQSMGCKAIRITDAGGDPYLNARANLDAEIIVKQT